MLISTLFARLRRAADHSTGRLQRQHLQQLRRCIGVGEELPNVRALQELLTERKVGVTDDEAMHAACPSQLPVCQPLHHRGVLGPLAGFWLGSCAARAPAIAQLENTHCAKIYRGKSPARSKLHTFLRLYDLLAWL